MAASVEGRFARSAAWALAGSLASRSVNFASWVVCARLLGKTNFGALTLIQSTLGMFGVFAGMGLGLTATKYIAELRESDAKRAGRVLGLCSISTLICGATVSAFLVGLAPALARYTLSDPSLSTPVAIGSSLVLLNAINGYQTGTLAGLEAFRTIATISLWTALASFPLMVIGIWLAGLNGAVLGLAASLATNWILNHVALRRECMKYGIKLLTRGCTQELRILWQFSLPALLTSVLISPAIWVCNMWLVRSHGYAELGLYGAADRFRLAVLFVPAAIFSTIVPMLSKSRSDGDSSGFRRIFRANLLLNLGIVSLPCIAIAILARPLMLMYGSAYRAGWPILIVLSLSAIPEALNTILGQPLITNAMWVRLGFDVLLVSCLLICAKLLIPIFGGLGLALAYASAFLLASATIGLYLKVSHLTTSPLGQLTT